MNSRFINVLLSKDDFTAAREIFAWVAYPDRPHMRVRERDQSTSRNRCIGEIRDYLLSEAYYHQDKPLGFLDTRPKYSNGRVVSRQRLKTRIDRFELLYRRSAELGWAAQFAFNPMIKEQESNDEYWVVDYSKTVLLEELSTLTTSEGAPNTAEDAQYRNAIRNYVEPYAASCHLALAVHAATKGVFDNNHLIANITLNPSKWLDSILQIAADLENNTRLLTPNIPVFHFSQ